MAAAKASASPAASASSRRLLFGSEAERFVAFLEQSAFAAAIRRRLFDALRQFGPPLFGASRFLGQLFGKDGQPLQRRAGRDFPVAQGLHGLVGHEHHLLRLELDMLSFGQIVDQRALFGFGFLFGRAGADPADVEQRRLGLADFAAQPAVARRQPGLPLQLLELLRHLVDDVFDAFEVLLGCLEPQFGLVPT